MIILSRKHVLFLIIFLSSFLWMLSLTSNFGFLWEDSYIIGSYNIVTQNPTDYTISKLILLFLDTIIAPEQFYGIAYGWKPIQEKFIYFFAAVLFGNDFLQYRIARALLFAIVISLSVSFLLRPFSEYLYEENTKGISLKKRGAILTIVILFMLYVIMLPEFWVTTLYMQDTLLITLLFSAIALALFFLFYKNENIQNRYLLALLFFLILFFTELSILTKHIGRINFAIISLFFLFTDYKKLFKPRYLSLIIVLFCLSFPILGVVRVFEGESLFAIIGLSGHLNDNTGEAWIFETLLRFFSTAHLAFSPHAYFLIAAFVFFLALQLFCLYTKREAHVVFTSLKELVIFSGIWFVLSAFIFFIARGFVFDPMHFLRFEFGVFLIPQTLFLVSYCLFVLYRYFPESKKLFCILIIFLLLATAHNALRLNEWRGGWGAYFLGYDTVREYVDTHESNAVVLLEYNWASPIIFLTSNKAEMVADLTNDAAIYDYAANYSAVYIVQRFPLQFSDPAIVNVANLTIVDNSPYGWLKKAVNKYYIPPMYVYQLES